MFDAEENEWVDYYNDEECMDINEIEENYFPDIASNIITLNNK